MNKYVKREIDKYGSVLFLALKEGLSDFNTIVTKELIIIGEEEITSLELFN